MEDYSEIYYKRIIGANIRRILKAHGRTQTSLARQIGSTRESIGQSIAGKAAISLRRICEIAAALDVDVTDLLLSTEDQEALEIGRDARYDPVRADILRILSEMEPETLAHIYYILRMMSHNTKTP